MFCQGICYGFKLNFAFVFFANLAVPTASNTLFLQELFSPDGWSGSFFVSMCGPSPSFSWFNETEVPGQYTARGFFCVRLCSLCSSHGSRHRTDAPLLQGSRKGQEHVRKNPGCNSLGLHLCFRQRNQSLSPVGIFLLWAEFPNNQQGGGGSIIAIYVWPFSGVPLFGQQLAP